MYRRLAGFSIRYAKTIVVVWLCCLPLSAFFAARLPAVLKDHGLRTDGAYARVERILASDFHQPADPVIVLFEKGDSVSGAEFHEWIARTLHRFQGVYGLSGTVSPLERKGMERGNAAYALLSFRLEPQEMRRAIQELRQLMPYHPHITVAMTGKAVVQEDVNETSRSDLLKAELIGIPAAFFILWLSFGGIVASVIPVLVGFIGVTVSMGIMYKLSAWLDLSVFVLNVIPMVGLAVSIDFALMLVSRFREELRQAGVEEALRRAMGSAGRAIWFSALCVGMGLAGILFIPMPIFSGIALGAMVVLAVSLLLTLTLAPALLSLTGHRIGMERRHRGKGFWYALSGLAMRRPVPMCLLASGVLLGCLLPAAQMNLAVPDAASLPQTSDARKAAERFSRLFIPPNTSLAYIIAETEQPVWRPNEWQSVSDFAEKLKREPGVVRVDSAFADPAQACCVHGNRMLLAVTLQGGASSKEAMDAVRRWEQSDPPAPSVRLLVGGEPKYRQEVADAIFGHIAEVLLFICVTNYTILYLAFRSLLLPVKTLIMNFLSIGASFGILVWIFEGGRLGIEPSDIAIMIPVFIFGLTFGISMDYGVFLLARIAELYRATGDNDDSVREGLAMTGKIITSAAAIMIAVTAPFAWGGVSGVKQLGIGIAAAIGIDATIVRMVLVPSLMKLLGRWNWWSP